MFVTILGSEGSGVAVGDGMKGVYELSREECAWSAPFETKVCDGSQGLNDGAGEALSRRRPAARSLGAAASAVTAADGEGASSSRRADSIGPFAESIKLSWKMGASGSHVGMRHMSDAVAVGVADEVLDDVRVAAAERELVAVAELVPVAAAL